jgi:membrane associated rhomboid family serine protease
VAVCYRHTNRETGVSCSSCGRPICPDCMTPTSVGMRCPECSRERTKVRTARTLRAEPTVTHALIAVNVLAYLGSTLAGSGVAETGALGGSLNAHGGLEAGFIAQQHEYWRIVTAGFLHANILHLALNMFFIYVLGGMLEPAVGHVRFLAIYVVALLAGSLGALVVTPDALTVGASGAGFGILGAALIVARDRGISVMESGLGVTLLINLAFSFTIRGISIGGHIGGLIGGVVAAIILVELGERRRRDGVAYALCAALAVAVAVAAVAVARSHVGSPAL